MPIAKGKTVVQIVTPIEGKVAKTEYRDAVEDGGTGYFEYLIAFTTADGEAHEKWFKESEVTEKA